VETVDGEWVDVEALDGGLIVNLGDLMQRWTNDRWRSTMHRVVPAGSGRRLSIPFFHNANWDARVECIVTGGEEPRYPPTTAGHHLMEKFRSTRT
jgi:isopenicillin N synthase-like dioxygenase